MWLPIAAAVVAWLPSLGAPPLLDERVMTYEARKWIGLDPLAPWLLPIGGSGTWRPLTTYAFWLDAGLPWPLRHAFQLLLHAAFVGLAGVWLRARLTASGALAGGLVLALHASHAATAGWIGGRADLAMATCAVGALVAADRRRWLLTTVLATAAVLFKETGVVVAPLLLLSCPDRLRVAPAAVVAGLAFAAAVLLAGGVAGAYWPGPSTWGPASRLWAPSAVELAAPFFVPAGVPAVPRDLVGIAVAAPVAGAFVYFGAGRKRWQQGVAVAVVALLPVLHVLPNDGGQWYLLLPTLGIALAWGDLLDDAPVAAACLIAACAIATGWEGGAWKKAGAQVEQILDAGVEPPPQDVRDWPHRGPSFCCGVPYQVRADVPRGWGPITEPAPPPPEPAPADP